MNPVILASDTVRLGVDGNFEIPVDLKPDTSNPDLGDGDNTSLYYDYKVQLSVTNVAGETQTSETSLRAGKTSLLLFADISGLICKDDSVKATFRVNNLDRKPVSVEGSYRLFLISDYQKSKPLKEQDVSDQPALSGSFRSNEEILLSDWKKLPSGAYKLVASVKDDQGRKVDAEKVVILLLPMISVLRYLCLCGVMK